MFDAPDKREPRTRTLGVRFSRQEWAALGLLAGKQKRATYVRELIRREWDKQKGRKS